MVGLLPPALLALAAAGQPAVYQLSGQILPPARAAISLYGATTPFSSRTTSDAAGRFRFRKLSAGAYTVAVFIPARGEARTTVDVGPAAADRRGRVALTLNFKDSDFVFSDAVRRHAISARQLAIPTRAQRHYEEAQKDLARRDTASAIAHLEQAVTIAPQFDAAWNNLGTIAYQTRRFDEAEKYFRQALAQNPASYEALVNLGGVLATVNRFEEALEYNRRAVSVRPNDALGNSQLGMTYLGLGRLDLAEKYLQLAVDDDPAHFSHPQLLLAQIHLRQNQPARAAADLENFLAHHPDWPDAAKIRETIARLRSGT